MEILAGEQTALHIAVCLGLMPLVEKALPGFTRGMNSNQSPVHLAAKLKSGVYKVLIDQSEPSLLTVRDKDGNTPLHEAAISGHSPMLEGLVERLVEYRAYSNEINKKNNLGNTPLHLAFQFDHPRIVKFLVRKGADLTIKNNSQVTALELGRRLGREDSLDILKQARKSREKTGKEITEKPMKKPKEGSYPSRTRLRPHPQVPPQPLQQVKGVSEDIGVETGRAGAGEDETARKPRRRKYLLSCVLGVLCVSVIISISIAVSLTRHKQPVRRKEGIIVR